MDYVNKIYLGDCGDVLAGFPDNSVDLIFTSPVYADPRRKQEDYTMLLISIDPDECSL